jgi:hypothetical protein
MVGYAGFDVRRRAARIPGARRCAVVVVCVALAALFQSGALAQNSSTLAQNSGGLSQNAPACTISGAVTAGHVPLPGVVLSLTGEGNQTIDLSSSAPDGSYLLKAPGPGHYTLKGDLVAFASVSRELVVDEACRSRVDLEMTLASRAPVPAPEASRPSLPASDAARGAEAQLPAGGRGQNGRTQQGAPGQQGQRGQQRQQGQQFQSLTLLADQAGLAREDATGTPSESAAQAMLPPGFSAEASAESVTALGSTQGSESSFGLGDRFQALRDQFGGPGGEGSFVNGAQVFGGGPGPGGRGGGPGGGDFGGFGGLGGLVGRGGRGRGNQLRGSFFQSFDTSGLDAGPFGLNGRQTTKPSYLQQHFGATIGGPLAIPKVIDASARTFFFLNYNGTHQSSPYDQYSNVPTEAERAGDFSALGRVVFDPTTHQPFAGNQIPGSQINPAAQQLLNLIPLPNQPGATVQNFHTVSTTSNQLDDINVRIVHNFSNTQSPGRGGGGGGGGGGGRGGGGRGGSNLNIGIHYRHANNVTQNPFPNLGGTNKSNAWDIPVGYAFTKGGLFSSLRFQFNRQHGETTNQYAFNHDIAGIAGLQGVSTDPFDWGAPNLSFNNFQSVRDVNPSMRTDQTISVGDMTVKTRGKQTFRFGGDYRDIRINSRSDANARGTFVFTGLFSGTDFSDFLLGLPQQSTVQFIQAPERFRSHSWDLFLQDDWRVAAKLTVNAGLRYEYYSPSSEIDNHLVTLDTNPDFTAAAVVYAGGTGPFSGALPDTIVRSFRAGLAPRIGIAWRPRSSTIVRTGYGINYSNSVYQSIAQQLATQPPFAVANTLTLTPGSSPVPLETALKTVTPGVPIQNTFAVDPNYRLGHVQIWNFDVQHDVTRTITTGIGYTGTRGSDLDVLRAPNRNTNGSRIADAAPFIWESSGATSILQSVSLRVRKRLTAGLAAGANYTLSKSIDNASSIGGGGSVVAQNDQNLAAERGLSSFDQRHRFTGEWTLELPFGPNRRWFNEGGRAALLGGWVLNGNVQLASGTPFTARVLGNIQDVARGTNGTLRANYNGAPIALADPTTTAFFNTSAFSPPPSGTFGNAGRNTIIGPGTSNVSMGLTRNITFGQNRGLSIQLLANNVFNTVQFSSIDTAVNSRTFGYVTAVRQMRRVQVLTRFRF